MNTPNAGKPFTVQDDTQIRVKHGEGSSVKEIASDLGRTESGIVARLERLGLRPSKVLAKQAALVR
jgi:IS30 family transposase